MFLPLSVLRLFACGVLLSTLGVAQDSVYLGNIGGRVTDRTGAIIMGAQVTVRQTDTNLAGTGTTDQDGRFRFPYLRLGPYEVKVSQSGFAPVTRQVTLTVGSTFDLQVELAVEAAGESITVNETAVLETARTQIAGTVPQAEIRNLPLNGRISRSSFRAFRPPIPAAINCSPKPRLRQGRAFPSAANATFRTTLSSTDSLQTMTPRDCPADSTAWMW